MKKATQLVLLFGLCLSVLPSLICLLSSEPKWLKEGVYLTSLYILLSILCYWLITWLVRLKYENTGLSFLILSCAIPFVIIPNLYLNAAVIWGRDNAKYGTWHLLTLFGAMYQIASTVLIFIMSLAICVSVIIYNKMKKNKAITKRSRGTA